MSSFYNNHCPFCKSEADRISFSDDPEKYQYDCPACGCFVTTWETLDEFDHQQESVDLRRLRVATILQERMIHFGRIEPLLLILYRPNSENQDRRFTTISIQELEAQYPKTVTDRRDRALVNLAKRSGGLGIDVTIDENKDFAALFAEDFRALKFMIEVLVDDGLVTNNNPKNLNHLQLTAKGWNRIAELEEQGRLAGCKQVFVAMWFSQEMNLVYEQGFYPAIDETGFSARKINLLEHNEYVPMQIIAEIRKSRFLVADMTGQRGGVYFEAGFAMGLGIPVIWTCRESEIDQCHFDTKQFSHILWETPEDLKTKLVNRILATIV